MCGSFLSFIRHHTVSCSDCEYVLYSSECMKADFYEIKSEVKVLRGEYTCVGFTILLFKQSLTLCFYLKKYLSNIDLRSVRLQQIFAPAVPNRRMTRFDL